MCKPLLTGAAAAALLAHFAAAQTPTTRDFRIDAGHSRVGFAIPFLGSSVQGQFDDVAGIISYTGDAPSSSVKVTIAAASIHTGSAHRDEHLRSDDFFDVARFPAITFATTSIEQRDRQLFMHGSLTMHGVTRAISFPFRQAGPVVEDPHGSTLIHFIGAFRIAPKDYGIVAGTTHNPWFDSLRRATMGDSAEVSLDIMGWRTRER